jgi:4-amino-4-deoxy-L-arabinose transferase-like glycosyltransferase
MDIRRKILFAALIIFVGLLFFERPSSWLFDPDEARYAEIPQHMVLTGDYLTPKLNGSHYFEKPPLLYWLNALSMEALGLTPYAARLPTRLATLGMTLLLFMALRGGPATQELWGPLVFLSSLLPFIMGRLNTTDALVSFGLTLSLLSIREALIYNRIKPSLTRLGMWMGISVAVLSKGLIGFLFPMLILFAWAALMKQWRRAGRLVFAKEALVFIILTVPWFWLMEKTNPGFLKIFFIHEHLQRYFTNEANRTGSVFYFVPVLLFGLLPWTLYLFPAVKSLATFRLNALREQPDRLFFGVWAVTVFLFFSFSHSKLIPYLLPAFPALAALIGTYLAGQPAGPNGAARLALGWAVPCLFLIAMAPRIAKDYSSHDLAHKAMELNGDLVVAYHAFPHSFPLVLKKPVPVVENQNELATDGVLDPELFWSGEKFWTVWNSDQRVVVVYAKKDRDLFSQQSKREFQAGENRKYFLSANFDPGR